MRMKDCLKKKINSKEGKRVALSIRVTKEHSDWMRKNKLSPTAILSVASKELGFKE